MQPVALRLPPPPPPLTRAEVRTLLVAARAPELLREPVANCNTVRHLVRIA